MAQITFYPLGNADSCLIRTDADKLFVFDYADMKNRADAADKRIALKEALREDIGWPRRKEVDVLAITHGDRDHVQGFHEVFHLDHAAKYQSSDHIKVKELWVPAAIIVEEGAEDDTRVLRAEARHRLRAGQGIRVFSRPAHLKGWLENNGLTLESRQHLITDAGRLAPGFGLEADGIEFFVHSPFGERDGEMVLDRNGNCLVMQAVIRSGYRDTRFLITADSVSENWQKIVKITKFHGNEARLAWDILKIPHHCSYLSMAAEKGSFKTEPTDEFKWLLEQGILRSVMVSSSWEIPAATTDQPPHVETWRRYGDTRIAIDAELVATMEHPSKSAPKRLVIEVDGRGAMLKKSSVSMPAIVTSTAAPRVG